MKIVLCSENGNSAVVEVVDDTEISTIKILAAIELDISSENLSVHRNATHLFEDSRTLRSYGIKNDDMLLIKTNQRSNKEIENPGQIQYGMQAISKPDELILYLKKNPLELNLLDHHNPELAAAVKSNDVSKVRNVMMLQQMTMHRAKWEKEQMLKRVDADPTSVESQQKIEEFIRQQAVDESYARAMEETPEVFGRVTMLYIDIKLNKYAIKAFVDSGAQATIMSLECAREANLDYLIDRRFQGEARGVGTAKILGRIHIVTLEIGGALFDCSVTVLEKTDVAFLFGLDMLKRHQCIIDLMNNCLRIGSGNITVPFLSEKDLPLHARDIHIAPPIDLESTPMDLTSATPNLAENISFAKRLERSDLSIQVSHICSLGFTEEEAIYALQQSDGDINLAISLLIDKKKNTS